MFCSLHELPVQCTDIRKKLMLHVPSCKRTKKTTGGPDVVCVNILHSHGQNGMRRQNSHELK